MTRNGAGLGRWMELAQFDHESASPYRVQQSDASEPATTRTQDTSFGPDRTNAGQFEGEGSVLESSRMQPTDFRGGTCGAGQGTCEKDGEPRRNWTDRPHTTCIGACVMRQLGPVLSGRLSIHGACDLRRMSWTEASSTVDVCPTGPNDAFGSCAARECDRGGGHSSLYAAVGKQGGDCGLAPSAGSAVWEPLRRKRRRWRVAAHQATLATFIYVDRQETSSYRHRPHC